MKLIIDVPEGIYDTIQDDQMLSREQLAILQKHILNGTPYEEPEVKGDLISREALKKVIEDSVAKYSGQYSTDMLNMWGLFAKIIDNAPTVERPKGKWQNDSDNLPVCSECGEVALQRMFIKLPQRIQDVRLVRSNFCPNCGCDMRGEEE